MAENVRRALMGHAQVAMTSRYGEKDGRSRRIIRERALIGAIDMARYDGPYLSHVALDAGYYQEPENAAAEANGSRPKARSRR